MVAAGYIDPIDFLKIKNEKEDKEWSLSEQEQEPFQLDFLLDSNHQLFFQDRFLTKEEKAKIKSVIEIVLKDCKGRRNMANFRKLASGKWQARVQKNGKLVSLGTFKTKKSRN